MTPAMIMLAVALSGPPDPADLDALPAVVAALHDRNRRIQSITCRFEFRTLPSDFLINQRSKADGRKREDVIQQYSSLVNGLLEEMRDGLFHLDLTRLGPQGQAINRRSLYYDGKKMYATSALLTEGGDAAPTVEVNGKFRTNYDIEAAARRFLGDTVLPTTDATRAQVRPLFAQIEGASDRELLPREAVGGADCVVVRWRTAIDEVPRQETVWLDDAHGLAMRRYREELLSSDERWVTTTLWEVRELASYASSGADTRVYWYPRAIDWFVSDASSNPMFNNKLTITDLRLNEKIPAKHFAPQIEDGSSVLDATKGRSVVHGGGLSPRLRRKIERRVADSRQGLAPEEGAADRVMTPGRRWTDFAPMTAMTLGGLGLCAAAWVRRRS